MKNFGGSDGAISSVGRLHCCFGTDRLVDGSCSCWFAVMLAMVVVVLNSKPASSEWLSGGVFGCLHGVVGNLGKRTALGRKQTNVGVMLAAD